MLVQIVEPKEDVFFSQKLVDPATGQSFPEIEPHTFSFNSPHGACPACNGLGFIKEVDPRAVIDPALSINEGGILPWAGSAGNEDSWAMQFLKQVAREEKFSLDIPIRKLSKRHLDIILHGTGDTRYKLRWGASSGHTNTWHAKYEGVLKSLQKRYEQTESEQVRRELEEYMDEKPCGTCKGLRLKPEALAVTLRGLNIADVCGLSIEKAHAWTLALQEGRSQAVLAPAR
jgi:excinuclease ABC subunit A